MKAAGDHSAVRVVDYYTQVVSRWLDAAGLPEFTAGYSHRAVLIQEVQTLLEDYPLLLMPTSAEPPFVQDIDIAGVAGAERFMRANCSMLAIAALSLPALAVPSVLADGLLVGVQLVGRRHSENLLLAAGAVIEQRAGGLTPIEPRLRPLAP